MTNNTREIKEQNSTCYANWKKREKKMLHEIEDHNTLQKLNTRESFQTCEKKRIGKKRKNQIQYILKIQPNQSLLCGHQPRALEKIFSVSSEKDIS